MASLFSLGKTIAAAYLKEATDETIPVIDAKTAATPKCSGVNRRATTGIAIRAITAATDLPDIRMATLPIKSEFALRMLRMTGRGIGTGPAYQVAN